MPIGAINFNLDDQQLCLRGTGPLRGSSQYFCFRRQGTKVFVDDSPIVDESTRPWTVIEVNEIQVGSLTGNFSDQEKHDLMVHWGQRYLFDTIISLSSLSDDDPDKTIDPDTPRSFWGNEDGTKNPSGLWMTSRGVLLVDFNMDDLANGILTASLRKL